MGLLKCLLKQIKTSVETLKSKMANTKGYHLAQSRANFEHPQIISQRSVLKLPSCYLAVTTKTL